MTSRPHPISPLAPRHVAPPRVLHWFTEGWRIFAAQPLAWLLIALLTCVLLLTVFVPVLGRVIAMVLLQVMSGGMVALADQLRRSGRIDTTEAMTGFGTNAANLAIVGLLFGLALTLAGLVTFVVALVTSALAHLFSSLPFGLDMVLQALFADWLVTSAITLLVLLALWFAPALVVLERRPPFEAMRLSLAACLANPGATVLLAVLLLVGIPAVLSFTLGLGILLVLPLVVCTAYASYREVFAEPEAPEPAPEPSVQEPL